MILILVSWIFFFFSFLISGIALQRLLRIQNKDITISILLGIFGQTIIVCSAAFFIPIGYEFYLANVFLTLLLAVWNFSNIKAVLFDCKKNYSQLRFSSKAILGIVLFTAVLKSATVPYILDNESYYIQTIKWVNEYGFVKGLANFNIAFGQTSPWQVLQAAFNFSFWTDRLNDLNGFLMLVCSTFFVFEYEKRLHFEKQVSWLIFILIFNTLSFQFINTPSPDFPIFLIGQIVLYLTLEKSDVKQTTDRILILLVLFLTFIKVTFAPLAFVLLIFINFRKTHIRFTAIVGALISVLWIAKNIVLTGFPFYPFAFAPLDVDWRIPNKLLANINNMIKNHEFLLLDGYQNFSLFQKFLLWIQFDGVDGFFNRGIVLLLILVLFTTNFKTDVKYRIVYAAVLFHFIFVFCVSPQFRFFLIDFLFLASILMADVANRMNLSKKLVSAVVVFSVICPLGVAFVGNFKMLTSNKHNQKSDDFLVSQLYLPAPNSKYDTIDFEVFKEGNLIYYSPNPNFFFYGTADGPLPCTNVRIIERFKKKYRIVPQLRTGFLKDGFYSQTLTEFP